MSAIWIAAMLMDSEQVSKADCEYSTEPNIRMERLINQSENYRENGEFWRKFWFNDPIEKPQPKKKPLPSHR